jgi:hypothetical protein
MSTRFVLGMAGSVLLALGVFLPLITMPIVGSMNYFQNGRGDGTILLVVAVVAVILAAARRLDWLLVPGAASVAMLIGTFIRFQQLIGEMRLKLDRDLAGNPFRSFADVAVGTTQLQWGWLILIVGAVLLIVAALLKEGRALRKCPHCAERIQYEATVCKHCKLQVPAIEIPAPKRSRKVRPVVIVTAVTVALIIAVTWFEPMLTMLIEAGVI